MTPISVDQDHVWEQLVFRACPEPSPPERPKYPRVEGLPLVVVSPAEVERCMSDRGRVDERAASRIGGCRGRRRRVGVVPWNVSRGRRLVIFNDAHQCDGPQK
jgi:hypothetical protein